MAYFCFNCSTEISLDDSQHVGRRDECSKCGWDLHVCKNCKHYDTSAYNECRETQAERVLDKDKSNFCDYFQFNSADAPGKSSSNSDSLKALDDLFKK